MKKTKNCKNANSGLLKSDLLTYCGFALSVSIFMSLVFSANAIAYSDKDNYSLARIQWPDRCYTLSNFGTVKILEPDNNIDTSKPDRFEIQAWSSHDKDHVIDIVVTETDNSTGIFEGHIPFGEIGDEISPHELIVSKGDTLMTSYVDTTLPQNISYSQIPVTLGTQIKNTPNEFPPLEESYDGQEFLYDPCVMEAFSLAQKNNRDMTWLNVTFPTPVQQLKSGLYLHEVKCKQGLVISFRYDDFPACVKASSIPKLFERGWVLLDSKLGLFPTSMPLREGGHTSNPESVVPWLFMKELMHRGIPFENQQHNYQNTAGYLDNTRACSLLVSPNGTSFYISTTFHTEPFEITGISIDQSKPVDCYKYWIVSYGTFGE
jgi:hypothetical protein